MFLFLSWYRHCFPSNAPLYPIMLFLEAVPDVFIWILSIYTLEDTTSRSMSSNPPTIYHFIPPYFPLKNLTQIRFPPCNHLYFRKNICCGRKFWVYLKFEIKNNKYARCLKLWTIMQYNLYSIILKPLEELDGGLIAC